jgi:transcriptional regulator with XRE-family HTH domain
MSIVSNNIKYLRRLNGLTQEQFSRRIGIKRSLLGAYEEARANPNLDNLKMIAQVFGTTVDSLIKTDIRKIKETPGLNLSNQPQSIAAITNKTLQTPPSLPINNFTSTISNNENVEFERETNHNFIDKFYQSEPATSSPQKPVIQNVVVPTFNSETTLKEPEIPVKSQSSQGNIRYVRQNQIGEYINKSRQGEFLNTLPIIQLPNFSGGNYRAFEAGSDFAFQGAMLIGKDKNNYDEIVDGKNYILVTAPHGIIYRRIYNQSKIKGTFLLSSDQSNIPSFELQTKDVLEVWEIKAFVSFQLPEPQISVDKVKRLIEDLQEELSKLS